MFKLNNQKTNRWTAKNLAPVLVWFCVLAVSGTDASAQADKQDIVKRASRSYYSLRRLGLLEFRAKVEPNWQLLAKDFGDNPEAMKLLRGLMFSIFLKSDGSVRVDHDSSLPIPASQEANVQLINSSMKEMLTGFFMTWNTFMLSAPLPPIESEYQLQDLDGKFLLRHKEGTTDVSTTLSKELAIEEIRVSSNAFNGSVKPQLAKTADGYVLMGYQASYEMKPSAGKSGLVVQIVYQEIKGLQLPGRLNLQISNNGSPVTWELQFTQPQVKTVEAAAPGKSN